MDESRRLCEVRARTQTELSLGHLAQYLLLESADASTSQSGKLHAKTCWRLGGVESCYGFLKVDRGASSDIIIIMKATVSLALCSMPGPRKDLVLRTPFASEGGCRIHRGCSERYSLFLQQFTRLRIPVIYPRRRAMSEARQLSLADAAPVGTPAASLRQEQHHSTFRLKLFTPTGLTPGPPAHRTGSSSSRQPSRARSDTAENESGDLLNLCEYGCREFERT